MDAHFQEYLAAVAGMHEVYGAAGGLQAPKPQAAARVPERRPAAQAAGDPPARRSRMRWSAGPTAIVVMTHISTQATNSRRSINSAS